MLTVCQSPNWLTDEGILFWRKIIAQEAILLSNRRVTWSMVSPWACVGNTRRGYVCTSRSIELYGVVCSDDNRKIFGRPHNLTSSPCCCWLSPPFSRYLSETSKIHTFFVGQEIRRLQHCSWYRLHVQGSNEKDGGVQGRLGIFGRSCSLYFVQHGDDLSI